MPNTRSAAKQARAAIRRRTRNLSVNTAVKKAEKQFRSLVKEGKTDEAIKALPRLQSVLDRAVKSGVLHKNTSSRHKSRVAALIKKK